MLCCVLFYARPIYVEWMIISVNVGLSVLSCKTYVLLSLRSVNDEINEISKNSHETLRIDG